MPAKSWDFIADREGETDIGATVVSVLAIEFDA